MKPRVLFCLPTYNNPNTVTEVAHELLLQSENDLLVVDDGSHNSVAELFEAKHIERNLPVEIRDRIFHLRSEENLGKGMALRKAFAWAIPRGYTHMIAVDADGQHPTSESLKILNAIDANPWALIIGHRNMDSHHVPKVSKFGRKFSNFWVRYQTNEKVLDSQSGLRAYPLFHLQNFSFFTRRYDFEIEILIRLIWKKVPVVEVPVDVIYHPLEERVSHFRKFWDNARISMLNTVLVIVSLLRQPGSSFRLSAALGLGVWIGCLPLYGIHTILAGVMAFLFKLNFVALVVGTQISIPPFLPLLLPAAIKIGKLYTTFSKTKRFILGSITLGFLLGITTFFTTWISLTLANAPKKFRKWKGEHRGGRFGNWILKNILKFFGLRAAYGCVLLFVVPYFYLFVGRARRASAEYWQVLEPEINFFKLQSRILQHMYRYATVLLDSVYLSLYGRDVFSLESHGYDELKQTMELGKGLMMISAHLGAWEVSARALSRHEFVNKLHVVRFEGDGLTFTKVQEPAREFNPIASNRAELPVLQIREVLGRGEVISMMGDRPVGTNVELLNFFGKLVIIDYSPFRIALACGSPVFYAFSFRESYKKYSFYVGEIIVPSSMPKEERLHFLAQTYLKHLETAVKRHPDQWFNWFAFFSHAEQSDPLASRLKSQN